MSMTAYQVAEAIQSRFSFDDDGAPVACRDRYMSDILGSDWASGMGFDNSTSIQTFYQVVIAKAERKYGPLPF